MVTMFDRCNIDDRSISQKPSWAPNFAGSLSCESLLPQFATGWWSAICAEVKPKSDVLEVFSDFSGTITTVPDPAPLVGEFSTHVKQLKPVDLQENIYITGETMLDAFIQTIAIGPTEDNWEIFYFNTMYEHRNIYMENFIRTSPTPNPTLETLYTPIGMLFVGVLSFGRLYIWSCAY